MEFTIGPHKSPRLDIAGRRRSDRRIRPHRPTSYTAIRHCKPDSVATSSWQRGPLNRGGFDYVDADPADTTATHPDIPRLTKRRRR